MFRRIVIAFFMCAAATLQGAPVHSAGLSDEVQPAASGWELEFTPYFWVLFINGDQTAGTNTADIDTNLFEIIDETKELYAFNSEQELRKGKLGIFADVGWAKMRVPANKALQGDIPSLPRLNVAATIKGGATAEIAIVEPGIAYEIFNRSSIGSFKDPAAFEPSTAIDVLTGARYWYLRTEIGLNVNVTGTVNIPALGLSRTATGGRRVDAATTTDWWDPYIGLRMRHKRGPGKEVVVRGDIGGFGVGSDLTWQLKGLYNFDTKLLGHDVTAHLGYRALYADYKQGSGARTVAYDWLWHGPVMGLKMRF